MIKYMYPNMPRFIDPSTLGDYGHGYVAEVKKNGWRCLAWMKTTGWEGGDFKRELELWTRRKTIIPFPLPLTRAELNKLPPDTMLDGELLERRTKDVKDHYYIFDILFLKGASCMHLPYRVRRAMLEDTVRGYGINCELANPVQVGLPELYKQAVANGDEGIVLKEINSKYMVDLNSCPHNPHWFKAKRAERCFVNQKEKR